MERHLRSDELVLHYYGEMSDTDETRTLSHLDACSSCRGELDRLQRILALVDAETLPQADGGLEARVWQRLAPEVRAIAAPGLAVGEQGAWARFRSWPQPAWGAAAAVLILAAFVAGRISTPPGAGTASDNGRHVRAPCRPDF